MKQKPVGGAEPIVLSHLYMGLSDPQAALAHFSMLEDVCRRYGGTFTFLWHNSSFQTEQDKSLYEALIA